MKTTTESTGTPQHELRTRIAQETKERKAKKKTKSDVLDTYYELLTDSSNKRGGKIRKVTKTKDATHRVYICREKERPEWVKKLKAEKKLVTV